MKDRSQPTAVNVQRLSQELAKLGTYVKPEDINLKTDPSFETPELIETEKALLLQSFRDEGREAYDANKPTFDWWGRAQIKYLLNCKM